MLEGNDGVARPDLLRGLVEREYAVLVLRDRIPRDVLYTNLGRIQRLFDRAVTSSYVNGTLTTVGPYLAKYLPEAQPYFDEAARARDLLRSVSFELAEDVRSTLRCSLGMVSLDRAREPDGREYAEAIVRIHADGVSNPLHNDNIMRDAASTDLFLAGLSHQLSCITCMQECDHGGELKIYRKPWVSEDERFKIKGGLGYDIEVVDGAACCTYKPRTGDIYLINPTCYHEIAEVGGTTRLTMGFFIGFSGDLAHAVAWS